MKKISLKDWVVLLTIVPTTVIGLAIALFFSYNRHLELNEFLTLRSTSIIEPIAIAGSEYIENRDREKLRNLINFTHRNHSDLIKNITVFTQDNQVFVTSAYHGDTALMRLKAGDDIPHNTQSFAYDDYLIFHTPIIKESNTSYQKGELVDHSKLTGYIAMKIDRSSIKLAQQSELLIAFFIVFLGSCVSIYFTFNMIKNVTRPISSMVRAVDRIREGKLESRVSGQLIGELNFLKNGINAMAQSLGDYHDEMQRSIDQATIDLRESLEQFEIQNVELDLAKRKAQDANKVKSEFLANMSHELRTPLNGVIGFTRQVLKTPLSETQRDYLQTIERSANNLLAIINDILDFSKLDAGKMVIESIPFALRDSIDETLTLLAPSTHKKNIELSLRVSPQVPDALIGDAMRIKQVLLNLANNAIKFTDKGGVTIDIEYQQVDDNAIELKFTIVDTGIGMSAEQQSSLFEAFGQADQSVTRLYGGTGLGLVISQRLSTEMEGTIGFHSEMNKGSTFWFTCRCEVNPMQINVLPHTHLLENKSILYFEGHTHSRMTTNETLNGWGMQVSPVASIVELTSTLAQGKFYDYALIGHDVTPTTLNDLKELITSIRNQVGKVFVAINSTSPSLQEALISAGAAACISKPITPARLVKALTTNKTKDEAVLLDATEQSPVVPIKVLAVDDNEANLKLINALLLEQVSEVVTATNGKQAFELCQNEKFALIFMDIQMPVMDGVTSLEKIQSETFNEETPIIAVTAHALNSEREELLEHGFSSYMTKPIDEAMLKHTIYEYCDVELFSKQLQDFKLPETNKTSNKAVDIDWPLAIQRAGKKESLAKDMLSGLLKTLPETKFNINEALTCQDTEQVKTLIHKLNGACCYTGVPNLGSITHQLETQLKKGVSLDDLEPEFFEFFEHIENLMVEAPNYLDEEETES